MSTIEKDVCSNDRRDRFSSRPITFEQCLRLEGNLKDELELMDYQIRSTLRQAMGCTKRHPRDQIVFLQASTIVLLSITASIHERSSTDTNARFDLRSFIAGARNAASWVVTRKLRLSQMGSA
jgi:hypothetical protein